MSEVSSFRPITGRERRKDQRQFAVLHSMVKAAGHEGHDWIGIGVPPTGGHLVAHLYSCGTCDEVLFVTLVCMRPACRDCFPEGVIERAWARWKRRRRNRV